ncbi:MAG: response regulator [Bacteroidales bacterium]|jgi:signal transduction histidine kinase/DNA-binding response OmpR family regulator/ligand-binding sensor domain-containing protein|nr:response regulator [Bacteroidales bacterium]
MNSYLKIFEIIMAGMLFSSQSHAKSIKVDFSVIEKEITTSVVSDSYGYIWIGTSKGLYKYDGNNLTKYSRDSTHVSLMHSMIQNVLTDDNGAVYACNIYGYSKYNREKDTFYNVYSRISNISVQQKLPDGNFLAYIDNSQLAIVNETLEKVLHTIPMGPNLVYNSCIDMGNGNYCVYEPQSILIVDAGLNIVSRTDVDTKINHILIADGRIFVATDNGIKMFSFSGQEVHSNPLLIKRCSGKYINLITKDTAGDIIVGIADEGLYRYSHENDKISFIRSFDESDGDSRGFRFLFLDTGNRLWINRPLYQYKVGCFIIETVSKFPEFTELVSPDNLHSIELPIYKIDTDEDNRLFVLSEGGIWLLDNNSGLFKKVQLEEADSNCIHFKIDDQNRLWLVKFDKIYTYQIEQDNFRLLKCTKLGKGWQSEVNIIDLHDDYLFFMDDYRIVSFNKNIEASVFFIPERMPDYNAPLVAPSGKNILFRINKGDYVCFHPEKGFWEYSGMKIKHYIMDIMTDSKGNHWFSTFDMGVVIGRPDSTLFTLDLATGLPDNTAYESVEDILGNIWITTTNGLVKYYPGRGKIVNYNEVGGKLYDLRRECLMKAKNGDVYVCGRSCILKINAGYNYDELIPPIPLIDYVMVNGNDLIGIPDKLVLKHAQKHLYFSFASIDFIRSDMIHYEYRMDGYDNDWNDIGNYTNAIYTNLPPGEYTFMLRARYWGGENYTSTSVLPIHIKYAFWQHPVFLLLTGLLLCTGIVYLISLFIRMKITGAKYRFKAENEELKVNLFSNLSHTFRTPISLIIAPFYELVDKHKWTESEGDLINTIDKNLARIMQLTGQLIDYDNEQNILDNPGYNLQIIEKDITPIIRDVAEVFRSTMIKNGLSFSIDMPESFVLPLDEDKVMKIFYNLISNAVKYTSKGGNIKISVYKKDCSLCLSVADTGVGIPDNMKQKIFERYFKNEKDKARKEIRSFGVGLAHTKQLVSLHKGEILVSDNKPRGVIFTFTLPLGLNSYEESEVIINKDYILDIAESDKLNEKTQENEDLKLHILIVEDNDEMSHFLQQYLNEEYSIIKAKDGIEAIEAFSNNTVDLTITDVMMPRMNGYDLCKWIKGNPEYCHIPVVILTAKSSTIDKLEGIGCGAEAYITKPFEAKLLRATISTIIENKQKVQRSLHLNKSVTDSVPTNLTDVKINVLDKRFMEKLYLQLNEHLTDINFGITEICRETGFSRTSFYKKIRALTGITPYDFITNYRFSKVVEIMKTGDYTLAEIAEMTGFSSPSAFSRKFRSEFGVTPSEYYKNVLQTENK